MIVTRKRVPFPEEAKITPDALRLYLKGMHDDLFPQVMQFSPVLTGVTNATATGNMIRQGRFWMVSVVITPSGTSVSTGGTIELPFLAFAASVFSVKVGSSGDMKCAVVLQGTQTLLLPNWSTAESIIISGVAGE